MEGYHYQNMQQQQEDSSYNSTSENELESDTEDDPEKLLNEWLGELHSLTGGLDNVAPCAMRPLNSHLNTPRIDSYRFSMANLEDSQETELDAILGELCALETQCDQALSATRRQHLQPKPANMAGDSQPVRSCPQQQTQTQTQVPMQHRLTHSRSSSEGTRAKPDGEDSSRDHVARTDSPDNDSAFSDNVSMLSSESSASSGGSGGRVVGAPGATDPSKAGQPVSPTSQMDVASRAKAEKIKIALEKMREASVKKLFIKAFGGDGSSKSLLVDEAMTAGHVARLLADKNHTAMDPCWAVVEHLPELHMERVYEDHELLVENLLMWTRDSKNKLLFVERPDKVALFTGPEAFLLPPSQRAHTDFDDHARTLLLEEFFSGGAGVPEVEGPLYLKSESKKGWKRHHFVLRASGLYYLPKEKARSGGGGSSARDLTHLASFDVNQVYYGVGWRKKYKAPTDFCFAIKHPRLQQPKSTKYIKFLCAEDEAALHRWVVGIRLAKFGRQLMDNYQALVDELAQDDLDQLAQARSCSVSSIAPTLASGGRAGRGPTSPSDSPGGGVGDPVGAADAISTSSSSSGCLSDGCCGSGTGSGGTASTLSGNTAAAGFECDFPTTGTIKRKPSVNPKLPLTSITRQLKEVGETVACSPSTPSPSTAATTPTSVFSPSADLVDSVNTSTIQRAGSVRRRRTSCQTPSTPDSGGGGGTDSGSNSSTLKRHHSIGGGSARGSASSSSSSTPVREPPPPLPVPAELEVEEELPPPPADMFESTLSLDSLPPPPPPQTVPGADELLGSQLSLVSLPPPPPPYRPPPPAPTPTPPSGASTPTNCLSPTRRGPLATPPPVYSAPPYLAELKAAGSGPCGQPGSPLTGRRPRSPPPSTPPLSTPPLSVAPQSPVLLTKTQQRSRTTGKKISFAIPPESPGGVDGTRSLPPPAARKPPPPRRSESTRLTTLPAPQQLAAPPKDFLKDLQRVMKKKWQVAQKCKADLSMTPHEVLGFRDAPPPPLPPPDVRRENSVRDWVQEHYGGGDDSSPHQYNLYENVYLVGGGGSPAHMPPPGQPAVNGQHYPPYHHHQYLDGAPPPAAVDYRAGPAPGSRLSRQNSVAAAIAAKKRPPPPPPKRSETTQLTTTTTAVPPHARAPLPPPPHPSR